MFPGGIASFPAVRQSSAEIQLPAFFNESGNLWLFPNWRDAFWLEGGTFTEKHCIFFGILINETIWSCWKIPVNKNKQKRRLEDDCSSLKLQVLKAHNIEEIY